MKNVKFSEIAPYPGQASNQGPSARIDSSDNKKTSSAPSQEGRFFRREGNCLFIKQEALEAHVKQLFIEHNNDFLSVVKTLAALQKPSGDSSSK